MATNSSELAVICNDNTKNSTVIIILSIIMILSIIIHFFVSNNNLSSANTESSLEYHVPSDGQWYSKADGRMVNYYKH